MLTLSNSSEHSQFVGVGGDWDKINQGKAARTHLAVGLMLGSICSIINKRGKKGK